MKKILVVFVSLFIFARIAFSADVSIVPENDLWIDANQKVLTNGMTELKFNAMIDRAIEVYGPIARENGGRLKFNRKWSTGTVNASTGRSIFGGTWTVNMYGGLARHDAITADAFMLVICHELGHQLGGLPKKTGSGWASAEGQSDYFGSLKCMRKVLEDSVQVVKTMRIPAIVTNACKGNFSYADDIAICQRSAMAGKSLAMLFMALRNSTVEPKFTTPDSNVVTETNEGGYPATQCRMDTYFAGAVCDMDANEDVSDTDINQGLCARFRGYQNNEGPRPLCWYKPTQN